ncbi:MAG: hypothetical protein ACOZEN_15120 [Thermodesulfobacteriota bacterium]
MRVNGLDFTSAPGKGKPLAVGRCSLEEGVLSLEGFELYESYGQLEELLRSEGPWVMGCDFPFSHPARLLREAGEHITRTAFPARWPMPWEEYLRGVAAMTPEAFKRLMKSCPPDLRGVRERKRVTGAVARAASPMHVDFPPVGLMFHRGARLLLDCPCEVAPQRMNGDCRKLFEAYPGLFAERFCGGRSYKDGPSEQREKREGRRTAMLAAIRSERFRETYGFTAHFEERHARRMAADRKGDLLDAFICAIQAAWAWTKRHDNYGLPGPEKIDPETLAFEGWIMDPHCRM